MSEVFRISGNIDIDISEITNDLERIQSEARETSDRLEDIDDVDVRVDVDDAVRGLNRLEDSADEAEDGMNDLNDASQNTNGGFTILGGTIANFASNVVMGAINKVKDLISALFELPEATAEFRMQVAKLEGSTKQYGYSTETTNKLLKEMYGYLGDEQMAVNAISNLQGMKLSQSDLNAALDSAVAVWSAYGDSIPIESLTESINESAQVAKVIGSLADALNWAGISEDEFNLKLEKCTSTEERARLITETLNKAYGESKKTYDETTKSLRENQKAQFELTQQQAKLAEKIEPLTTKFTQLKATALEALLPVISGIVSGIQFLVNCFLSLDPTVQKVIIVLTTVAGTIFTVLGVIALLIPVVQNMITLFAGLGPVLTALTGPVGIVIAIITALIAIGVALYNNWDTIKKKASQIWNAIKDTFKTVCTNIGNIVKTNFNKVKDTVTNTINSAKDIVKKGLDAIKNFFNNCKLALPKIKLPHFSISGKLSLNPPSVPKLKINWYAKGGIIDSPTLLGLTGNTAHIGGEAGKEAIVPLDSFYDKIGDMIGNTGTNYVVNINFNGDMKLNNQTDMDKLAQTIDKKLQNFVNRNRKMKGDVVIV